MPQPPTEIRHPYPRALGTIRGVRAELVRLYCEGKAGLIEPALLGRLVHCLNTIQSMDHGTIADNRLTEIETRLARIQPNSYARANGLAVPR
jgi:hypothetical protein